MEYVSALLPFLVAGFMAAVVARFTGIAISMLLVPGALYMGAKPIEVASFMLTFVMYHSFTVETQDVRLNMKELTFFPGWRMAIPLVLGVGTSLFLPFFAVAFIMLCFILELSAALYKRTKQQERPMVREVVIHALVSSAFCVAGTLVLGFMPATYYFIAVGLVILGLSAFAWYAGQHRDAFRTSWNTLWDAFHFLFGLFGVEISSYVRGLRRTYTSKLDLMRPLITVTAAFWGLLIIFGLYKDFSLPALVAAMGASIGTRMFGVYEFTRSGSFSYVAIGLAVLTVLILYLVAPVPVGFQWITDLFVNGGQG